MDYQATCIHHDGADPDYRIDWLGGPGWQAGIDDVIGAIQARQHSFWTSALGHRAAVIVRVHRTSGRYYLTTEPDGIEEDNLSSLPECP